MKNEAAYIAAGVGVSALLVTAYLMGFFKKKTPPEIIESALQKSPRADDYVNAQVLHAMMRQCLRKIPIDQFFKENASQYQSNDDVLRLYSAFGTRGYDKCFHGLPQWFYTQMDLFQFMHEVAKPDERKRTNEWFASNNITFTI